LGRWPGESGGGGDGRRQVEFLWLGTDRAQPEGRPPLVTMGATVASPPSCEKLGIGGMGRLRPGAGLEDCGWTRADVVGSMLE
jgi:hypothetical protein